MAVVSKFSAVHLTWPYQREIYDHVYANDVCIGNVDSLQRYWTTVLSETLIYRFGSTRHRNSKFSDGIDRWIRAG